MGPYPREISVASNLCPFYKFNPLKGACFLALSYLIHIEMERTSHLVPFIIRLCSCKWWTGRCWMPPAIHSSGESVHWLLRGGFPLQKRLPFCQMMRTLPLTPAETFNRRFRSKSISAWLSTFELFNWGSIFDFFLKWHLVEVGGVYQCPLEWVAVPGGAHLLWTQRLGLRVAGADWIVVVVIVVIWRTICKTFTER